ncbi:MAG: polyamine aminopropyltransferase [Nitrososphaerota archaeon]|nr:polyamine aminopropyltransferase [Candidatus Calditenuaceae archaeon]MDW8073043.1 polyamine aminopropyltransferase [Nitrososphaerota archaeon]
MDKLSYWYAEWISEDVVESFKVIKKIYGGRTKYQRIDILETGPFGLCLLLDGKMQSSMLDEHIYHETLVHPAMCLHGEPRRVAVIGGGEGAALREVLRWKTVEEVFLVDLDKEVVELCQKYLPELSSGAFQDSRLKLFFEDGRRWVEELTGKVDVFIIDVTDPLEQGPSYLLYTSEFYRLLFSRLNEKGVVATHATSPTHTPLAFHSIKKTLETVFTNVSQLATFIVSFSSVWGFLYGSNWGSLDELGRDEVEGRMRRAGVEGLRFYSGATHQALLKLTHSYATLKKVEPRIIRDASPLYVT